MEAAKCERGFADEEAAPPLLPLPIPSVPPGEKVLLVFGFVGRFPLEEVIAGAAVGCSELRGRRLPPVWRVLEVVLSAFFLIEADADAGGVGIKEIEELLVMVVGGWWSCAGVELVQDARGDAPTALTPPPDTEDTTLC